MTLEQAAIAAVGALWLAFTGLGGGVVRHLLLQLKERDAACDARVAKLEAKLDESSDVIGRQVESQQKQIESQQNLITALQALAKGQSG